MKQGEDAIKRMAELDANKGMTGKKRAPEPREVGQPANSLARPVEVVNEVLSDADLAQQRLEQAEKMRQSAQQLLAEAERLAAEASQLSPTINVKSKTSNGKKTKVKAD